MPDSPLSGARLGKVEILRYTAVQDVGTAIHPSYVEGQMQGGVAQGVGQPFLYYAINCWVDQVAEPGLGHLDTAGDGDLRVPPPPELHQILDRLDEPEFLQADGTQAVQRRANVALHVPYNEAPKKLKEIRDAIAGWLL